jgi:hypothetical protein
MREWVLPLSMLLVITMAVAMDVQEGALLQDMTLYVGVQDSVGRQDTTSDCNVSDFRDPSDIQLFTEYPMTKVSGTMLRKLTVQGGNFTTQGRYRAVVTCEKAGMKGDMALAVRIVDNTVREKLDFVLGNISDVLDNQTSIYDHVTSINQSIINYLLSVNMSVYQHVSAVNTSVQNELEEHNTTIFDYLTNTIYSYLTGFITGILNTMNTSIGAPTDYGYNNLSAMINGTQERQVKRVLTVTGTALNSTGDPVTTGNAKSWVFDCDYTATPTCGTQVGFAHVTSIYNGTYSTQFQRSMVPGKIYRITTNVTDEGTYESVNVTTYINS